LPLENVMTYGLHRALGESIVEEFGSYLVRSSHCNNARMTASIHHIQGNKQLDLLGSFRAMQEEQWQGWGDL